MYMVRVFFGIYTTGRKVNHLVVFVHFEHAAHHPVAFCDLPGHLAFLQVDHVEVVPVVPFAHPYHFFSAFQDMAEHTAVVDKGGTAFLHECAYLSGFRIEFQHAVSLMAAFVIFKSHRFPVFFPFRAVQVVLAVEEFGRWNDGLSCFHVEYARHLEAQFVARLGVFLLVKDGLELAFGRAFHVIYIPFLGRTYLVGTYVLAVRAPFEPTGIVIAGRPVVAQRPFVAAVPVADVHIVVFDVSLPFPVGRDYGCRPFLIVHFHPVTRFFPWPFGRMQFFFAA